MRSLSRIRVVCALMLVAPLLPATVPPARAVTTHVVISEFATRGPTAATDEFVELYNPTDNPISLSGWKLQYKSAAGTVWSDRAILPASASIPGRGYFLIANQSYIGVVLPDFSSSAWTSGTGMADNGHERILDAGAVEIDKVGWGTAIDPEGTATSNHGISPNSNSVERRARASSNSDSMAAGGLHEKLGNGQDTDNNLLDFVGQNFGRTPQNSQNQPEPPFASGGNGTGKAHITPMVVYTNKPGTVVVLSVGQDSAYTVTDLSIYVPAAWTWSHSAGSVALAGTGFASASVSVSSDTIYVSQAGINSADGGTVTISDMTTPATKGGTTFSVRTAVAAGTPTPISQQPAIRALELVPIVTVHVNDAIGVCVAPYSVGSEVTLSGIVTANLSDLRMDVYVQDGTGGIDVFNAASPPINLVPGDSVTITGAITQFRGLTEITADFSMITLHATGRPVPQPLVITCADVNATMHVDFTEPNEGRLVRINGVTYNSAASTITDASGTTGVFIPITFAAPPSQFDLIGVLKQFKPGTPAPGPPYLGDYEVSPRADADVIPHPGPVILGAPYEDTITPTSVQLHWTTNTASTSIVHYGLTAALGDSIVDATLVTTHAATLPGLAPATVYSYQAGSQDVNGTNFSTTRLFSTASPPQSTGAINVYFNKSVDTGVAWTTAAHGNEDLPARLVTRLDNAHRSIDVAVYSLSGTPGATLASALIAARNRGIPVRVICEYDNSTSSALASLSSAGIPLINDRFDPINFGQGLMHNKFFVIDARGGAPDSAWVWTGSWNPTDPGTASDYQNAIELQDVALANAYTLEFNEMWGSGTSVPDAAVSRFGARKFDDTPHRFLIGGHTVESYFSPSDGANGQIISMINSAQHSIGFEVLTMTRSDISAALIAQQTAGLTVRGDLDNGTDTGSEYSTLVAAGVDVRLNTGGGLLHHKYCLVDAENPAWPTSAALTGSHNWSASAENSNNENTLIVRDPDVTNQYLQELAARYTQLGGGNPVVVVGVELIDTRAAEVSLAQNAPNPAHGTTWIGYAIPRGQHVELTLFDVQGREVQTLVHQHQAAGHYRVELSPKGIVDGMYFYRLSSGGRVMQRKLLFLR